MFVEPGSQEFEKERAWKTKQARRFARFAKSSNLDVESRVIVRQKQEQAAIRRKAAWIAKEVGPR